MDNNEFEMSTDNNTNNDSENTTKQKNLIEETNEINPQNIIENELDSIQEQISLESENYTIQESLKEETNEINYQNIVENELDSTQEQISFEQNENYTMQENLKEETNEINYQNIIENDTYTLQQQISLENDNYTSGNNPDLNNNFEYLDDSQYFENNNIEQEYSNEEEFTLDNDDEINKDLWYIQEDKSSKPKNHNIRNIIIASAISSVVGGIVVGLFLMLFSPYIISNNDYIKKLLNNTTDTYVMPKNTKPVVNEIQIENNEFPIVPIAEKVGPSVVGIKVTVKVTDFFFGARESNPQGSGIIIKSNGYIMTNNHVIADAMANNSNELSNGSKIEVILPKQVDKPYIATVVGRDQKTDLAVLKIDEIDLPAIEMGNSDKVKVGDLAIAIGNPGGLEYMGSVTAGIISGLNRTIPIEDGKELKLIQTDAAINPGNSGGALVNSQGQLIGINTAKIGGDGFEGLGFAIPVNKAKEITDSLINFKYVKGRPFLGITAEPRYNEAIAKQNYMPVGVYVADVSLFSGAYKAGIQKGDIITKFSDKNIKNVDEINDLKNKLKPGDKVNVDIYRDGKTKTIVVILGEEGAVK